MGLPGDKLEIKMVTYSSMVKLKVYLKEQKHSILIILNLMRKLQLMKNQLFELNTYRSDKFQRYQKQSEVFPAITT